MKEFLAIFRGGNKENTVNLVQIKVTDKGEYFYKHYGKFEKFMPLNIINPDELHYTKFTRYDLKDPIEIREYDITINGEPYVNAENNTLKAALEKSDIKARIATMAKSSANKRLIDLKGDDRKNKAEIKSAEHSGKVRQKILGYGDGGAGMFPFRPFS